MPQKIFFRRLYSINGFILVVGLLDFVIVIVLFSIFLDLPNTRLWKSTIKKLVCFFDNLKIDLKKQSFYLRGYLIIQHFSMTSIKVSEPAG